jgi:threonine synthase
MKFLSTRGGAPAPSISRALQAGLAPDGGLYVPEVFPRFKIEDFADAKDLFALASRMLAPFFEGDPLAEGLGRICERALSFPVMLKDLPQETSVLELFHGPTAAFKDVGARFLAECLAASGTEHRTILVATSGDTGGAVAAAFHGRPGFDVVIVFPEDGVSERQRKQLTAWGGNIRAYAVDGDFDACQRLVKSALSDAALKKTRNLSSANSINIGRLLPQATYYAWASLEYLKRHQVRASFIIPTGNAGNAVAAVWARKMGFPIERIGVATNANRVIPDYFETGIWQPTASRATLANAMDVGNASNMERLFQMAPLADIFSESVGDERIRRVIVEGESRFGEIWCPHTATAVEVRGRKPGNWVVVATAHPAKFESIVEPLIGHAVEIPPALSAILLRPSVFDVISGDVAAFRALLR